MSEPKNVNEGRTFFIKTLSNVNISIYILSSSDKDSVSSTKKVNKIVGESTIPSPGVYDRSVCTKQHYQQAPFERQMDYWRHETHNVITAATLRCAPVNEMPGVAKCERSFRYYNSHRQICFAEFDAKKNLRD